MKMQNEHVLSYNWQLDFYEVIVNEGEARISSRASNLIVLVESQIKHEV